MKKAFDQTVRDLKREVNKKVLKVPGIEQKVLDATSNEPWGPHGSHLADIAQATRNYHEYQMIMAVLWKRINDTGKNWRHVYKALTVLEYLVAHGSERIIDEIREHAYQISTLSDFQYIDSSGRDQGSNVRKKSQSLVVLVNDKDRIQEVRQKALANRDKYRNSPGGIYKPNSYSNTGGGYGDRYDDDRYESRYGNRDEDRNGYGREREWGNRDDDRYGRGGDSYGRDGDRYSRDSDERYGRDGYRDDDYRGGRSNDDYQNGSRHRSFDREKERPYDDDDRYSSRSAGGRADDYPQDERRLERKLSEQQIGIPPSYEEAVTAARSPSQNERNGGAQAATAPQPASPQVGSPNQAPATAVPGIATAPVSKEVDSFAEFDPRGSISATTPAASSAEMDIFGTLSDLASPNPLAIVPVTSVTTTSEHDTLADPGFGTTYVALSSASTMLNQPSENPFGESPFKATPSQDSFPTQLQNFGPNSSFPPSSTIEGSQPLQSPALKADPLSNIDFGDSFQGLTYTPNVQLPHTNQEYSPQELPSGQPSGDILADILPQSMPAAPLAPEMANFLPQPVGPAAFAPQLSGPATLTPQLAAPAPFTPQLQGPASFAPQSMGSASFAPQLAGPASFASQSASLRSFSPQQAGPASFSSQPVAPTPFTTQPVGPAPYSQQSAGPAPLAPQSAAAAPLGIPAQSQQQKERFEPKSTVWADTLSRGLVNFNISGSKTNPLADIGIDFDAINRKEKLKEKSSAAPVTSTVTMGKAMGSGSGIGRVGASGLAAPPNSMVGSGMGMGMGLGMGGGANMGMGMGAYGGGMNQPMGMGGMGMSMGMGMGMNMGMGRPVLPPSGPGVPTGYNPNPMMGMNGYAAQQPYGGYR